MSEWRAIAEWDWVVTREGLRLHAIESLSNDADEDWFGVGRTVCGLSGEFYIPGIFTRMGADRCVRCCDKLGFPRGKQSPKNVDECRPLVEARIASLVQ